MNAHEKTGGGACGNGRGVAGWLLCGLLLAAGAGARAAESFLWPAPARVALQWKETAASGLPRGLDFERVAGEGREPHAVEVCRLDLNADGTPEWIIDTLEGGTGGSSIRIYEKTREGFRLIGDAQGGVELRAAANGYYQLEGRSRTGGGAFSRFLLRFEQGRYRTVRLEDWKTRPGESEPSFAGVRDPGEAEAAGKAR